MVHESSPIDYGDRFRTLWQRCIPCQVNMNATPIYEDLVRRYGQPGRFYHGWSHLTHCLREFDRAAVLIEDPEAVELALWFHDAVYEPGAADNEKRSADLFIQWGGIGFPPAFVDKVSRLILITMHKQRPDEGDESYLADIDLSSFGVNWSAFLQDTWNVRKEQSHIGDAYYYPAHASFLNMLLNRPRIFHTDFFYEIYEESARRNINRLLSTALYETEV